ncbi:MAG: putative ABC transporter permease [Clostridiales bacterium]|nr:putative ABC transporter permease [Clostridiales bacterium]
MNNFGIINNNLYELMFYLIIYSFLGWCVEVAYAYKNERKFVNRGFLQGPLCPIYGCGCITLISVLYSFKTYNIFTLFIIATIVTSLIEYLTSYIIEKFFKRRYWDYTEDPFNIQGRVCLHFSLIWGILAVFAFKLIHPFIKNLIISLPPLMAAILFYIIAIGIMIDFIYTLASLINIKKLHSYFQIPNYLIIRTTKINYFDNIFKKNKRL